MATCMYHPDREAHLLCRIEYRDGTVRWQEHSRISALNSETDAESVLFVYLDLPGVRFVTIWDLSNHAPALEFHNDRGD